MKMGIIYGKLADDKLILKQPPYLTLLINIDANAWYYDSFASAYNSKLITATVVNGRNLFYPSDFAMKDWIAGIFTKASLFGLALK